MKFTFNWLKEFVTFKATPEKLAELLTMAGLEVEAVTPLREPETDREDWLLEVGVTPNRGDCLGINGVAREIMVLAGGRLKSIPVSSHKNDPGLTRHVSIAITSPRLCPRYSAKVIDNIRVGPSPDWMRFRLESCGIRSINNVVDITNYVMMETGQPLHAFDLERLPTRRINVRPANEIRKFTTLDGVERDLVADDLLICDGDRAVALAGVMGGMDSEVRDETRTILLESANFDSLSIRRTAKRLALHSEASHRFERGVDPQGTVPALGRAAYLFASVAGAFPLHGVADRYPRQPKPMNIALSQENIERLLGVHIEARQAEKLLRSIGLKILRTRKKGSIKVVAPTCRPDLTREADLIEELARLHGYQKIPSTLPLLRSSGGKNDHRLGWERRLRYFLAGEGMAEVVNLPFTTEKLNRLFAGLSESAVAPVAVLNPLAKESAEMRLSLIPGLIDNLRHNLAQRAESLFVYQLGKVFYHGSGGETEERQCLAGLLYGSREHKGLRQGQESTLGFLECKGLVQGILDLFQAEEKMTWCTEAVEALHPGRAATLRRTEKRLGYLGQIHPDVCEDLGVPPFLLFELDFEGLLEYAPRRLTVRSLPRFPSVQRDFAVVVDRVFPSQKIINWINGLGEALIENVQVFDQYLGSPIPEGKKSLAYKISYRANDRTLTDNEVTEIHQGLVEQIGKLFGAELRS